MRRSLLAGALLISIFSFAQTQYEVSNDGQDKILKGIITRDLVANDTSFKWYSQNQAGYKPDEATISALKTRSAELQLIVFWWHLVR